MENNKLIGARISWLILMAIVSTSHKFIYISGGKCATCSIDDILKRNRSIEWFEPAKTNPELWKMYDRHMPAKKIREIVGQDIWDNYFKFTFVRNTYSWVVSTFFFMVKLKVYQMPKNQIMSIRDFHNVIEYYKQPGARRYDNYPIRSQKRFISDEDNNIIVDFIGKFENLQTDFDYICHKLSLPIRKLSKENVSANSKKDWKQNYYFNKEAQDLVYKNWKIDIDHFNFKLEASDVHQPIKHNNGPRYPKIISFPQRH